MRPSSYPNGWNIKKPSYTMKKNMVTQHWTINGKCPKNTIPIRRTRREDILRAKSLKEYGRKDTNNIPQPQPTNSTNANAQHEVHISFDIYFEKPLFLLVMCIYIYNFLYMYVYVHMKYAIYEVKVNSPQAKFHGTKADINVWKPYVKPSEFSLAQIWMLAGRRSAEINVIEVGWQVLVVLAHIYTPIYICM